MKISSSWLAGKGRAERRRRWWSCSGVTDGEDSLAESGSRDRTDQVGFARIDSISCSEEDEQVRSVFSRSSRDLGPASRKVLRSANIVAFQRLSRNEPNTGYAQSIGPNC